MSHLGVDNLNLDQYIVSDLYMFLFSAEAKDRVVEATLALKQEGGETPLTQGEGAGESDCCVLVTSRYKLSDQPYTCR